MKKLYDLFWCGSDNFCLVLLEYGKQVLFCILKGYILIKFDKKTGFKKN